MRASNQLVKEEVQRLFEYRDGTLYWRRFASGRRPDLMAVTSETRGQLGGDKHYVRVGGAKFLAHYLVWNWHHGITTNRIGFKDGRPANFSIENLMEIQPETRGQLGGDKYQCPCCEQRVPQPTTDVIAHVAQLSPLQEAILRAVWSGKGRAVQPETIFNEMYADDMDGGPSASKMYAAFKVALCHLRQRLVGTGVSIENVGYRQGYRLVMKEQGN